MDFRDLALALKRATPSVWVTESQRGGQVAEVATEDVGSLTVLKAFTLEEREALRFGRPSRKQKASSSPQAPVVNSEATFLSLIDITRDHLNSQQQERFHQARVAFMIALLALILGIVLVFAGVVCIFVMSLPIGAVTAASSSISSLISALAFRFNKEANDRLDTVAKELSILDRASVAMYYISYITDAEKKDQAITDLTKQLSSFPLEQGNTRKG
jgi:ABC-type multidrug transport system fused ATPase/permease subunit